MHKFYEDLKDFISKRDEETKRTLIPYYETLYQLENYSEMKELLTAYEEGKYYLQYHEAGNRDFYSDGKIELSKMDNSISYVVNLEIGRMQGDYCQCEARDDGYNPIKRCCGIDCDVHLPNISIIKKVKVISHEFQGYECDLWALEDKWNTEYNKEVQYKQQLDNIKYIEDQIAEYQKALEVAKSQLQEN